MRLEKIKLGRLFLISGNLLPNTAYPNFKQHLIEPSPTPTPNQMTHDTVQEFVSP